ncbi:MAG: ABC transporter permease, partial [Gemmobacter sp.]
MKSPGLKIYTIAYLVFLYAPIALLPIFAFNDSRVIAFPLAGFTTNWFVEMWNDQQLWIAFKNSMTIAVSSALFATLFGIFAARASTRYNFPGKPGI